MAFTLLQAGSTLVSVNGNGALSSALTLPAGVSLSQTLIPRFAKFKQYVVLVNSPSRPLSIDQNGTVRLLTPSAPATPLVLSGTSGGTLSGTYLARQTYLVLDSVTKNIIAESDYGPLIATGATAIANKYLKAANINLSAEAISGSRIYRTTTGGAIYFKWIDTDGNTLTSVQDDLSDAGLPTLSGPVLGTVPDLTLCKEWKGRLWGVGRTDGDNLRFTEAGTMHAWGALNTIPIAHVGADAYGITALIPRRNALGVGKKQTITAVTGTTLANFVPTVISEECGVDSQESVVVYNDAAYWLWRDGVYKWDSTGISSITDGKVRAWFTTRTYFNRAMFPSAFASFEPETQKYRLYLCSAGSTVIDRWIEYDLPSQTWWGPHKTSACTPTCAVTVAGGDGHPYAMIGSLEGYLSQDSKNKNDWDLSPIIMQVKPKPYGPQPRMEKLFSNLTMFGAGQTAGNVTVTATVGELTGETPQVLATWDLTLTRHRLPILGRGKFAQLQFDHSALNEDVVLYGYELPYNVIGER